MLGVGHYNAPGLERIKYPETQPKTNNSAYFKASSLGDEEKKFNKNGARTASTSPSAAACQSAGEFEADF